MGRAKFEIGYFFLSRHLPKKNQSKPYLDKPHRYDTILRWINHAFVMFVNIATRVMRTAYETGVRLRHHGPSPFHYGLAAAGK